jgi:ABC-type sugar transport system ATPase subunit
MIALPGLWRRNGVILLSSDRNKDCRRMPDVTIQTKNLCKSYSGIKVLNAIDFSLLRGEVHAIVGENGAGKSTFIKLLAGAETPDEGSEIEFFGTTRSRLDPAATTGFGLAVIYQDISLFPNLSVMENMYMGLAGGFFVNRARIWEHAERAFSEFELNVDLNGSLGSLSVGQQQLVAVIRAVTRDAKIIIMDEPTASLSSGEVELLMRIIESLRKRQISIIYISHKLEEVLRVADRITVLRDGNRVATGRIAEFTKDTLITLMVGRELLFEPMQSGIEFGEALFEVEGLANADVHDVSFTVRRNEILGITGLVGAGRSELAQTIFGLRRIERGSMRLNGTAIGVESPSDAIRQGICYLPEDRHGQGLFRGQTLTWNITAATLGDMLASFGALSATKEAEASCEAIETLDIRPPNPSIPVEAMSGGNQQKVLLARWLRSRPKVLIVDEPTAGVDIGAKTEIHRLLRGLCRDGVAVILISSDLPEILALSDTVVVMRGGRVVRNLPIGSVTQESILSESLRRHVPEGGHGG